MTELAPSPLISCEWLADNLDASDQVIFDATYFLSRQRRDARAEYQQKHIPHALFFDIDHIADQHNPLPHTLPCAEDFAAAVGKLGVGNHTRVIIYDNNAFFAAARVWWMFRVFGHDNVRVLDGGMRRWQQLDLPLNADIHVAQQQHFSVFFRTNLVCNLQEMIRIQKNKTHQILDSRSHDSFSGNRPVTDSDLQPGHIPGSINIYYGNLRMRDGHILLPVQQLQYLFNNSAVNLHQAIVISCGTGVSAAVLALALFRLGLSDIPIYDGSWAEWGRQVDTPKQKD